MDVPSIVIKILFLLQFVCGLIIVMTNFKNDKDNL